MIFEIRFFSLASEVWIIYGPLFGLFELKYNKVTIANHTPFQNNYNLTHKLQLF